MILIHCSDLSLNLRAPVGNGVSVWLAVRQVKGRSGCVHVGVCEGQQLRKFCWRTVPTCLNDVLLSSGELQWDLRFFTETPRLSSLGDDTEKSTWCCPLPQPSASPSSSFSGPSLTQACYSGIPHKQGLRQRGIVFQVPSDFSCSSSIRLLLFFQGSELMFVICSYDPCLKQ